MAEPVVVGRIVALDDAMLVRGPAPRYCPQCGYSVLIHVDPAGRPVGCPPDEAAAVFRWSGL